jgi:hypothetical protein
MRIAISLLIAAAIPLAYWIGARQGRLHPFLIPPSAAEAFNLRSECAKLTAGIAEAQSPHSALGSVCRYDLRTNRCYAEIHINEADRLYDAQSGEVLAEVWDGGSKTIGFIKGGPDYPSPEAARAVIQRAMTDDRNH